MSKISEMVRDEADEADAPTPDEDEENAESEAPPTPEPEPEPETASSPPAMTEQQAEREFAKLERKASTYLEGALAIAQKLELPVQMCPLCTFPGLAIPRQAHEVTSDVEGAVLGLIGKQAKPKLKRSPDYARCEGCDGWGEVDTDAQKEISKAAVCKKCGGRGFVDVLPTAPAPTPLSAPIYPGAQLPYTPLPAGSSDAWNRPAGHPHWGLDPVMVGNPNGQKVG